MSMHQVLGFPEKHPRWATDANRTLEPAEGRKDEGWPADNKLPARWMNWLQNLFAQWTAHIGMTAVANWFKNPDMTSPLYVAVSDNGANRAMTSEDGFSWIAKALEANTWEAVAYGGGVFVAVARAITGTQYVVTSPDGVTWTPRIEAELNQWYSVIYGDGAFIVVSLALGGGGQSRVMTSTDGGITWVSRKANIANQWSSVVYGNDMFVAVSRDGANRVMTSTDKGITWTAQTAAQLNTWESVTFGNGIFVAVASAITAGQYVMTSNNGFTWMGQVEAETNTWESVAFGNGVFVAVASALGGGGTQYVMTSPDGIAWTSRVEAEATSWVSVTYYNGLFVAVASAGVSQVMTSPDGITWTSRTESEANQWRDVTGGEATDDLAAIIYHPDIEKWIASGKNILRSYIGTGGHEWETGGLFSATPQERSIGIDATRFLVGDTAGNIQYSTDGAVWSQELSAAIGGAGAIFSLATRYPTDTAIMVLRTNATVYRAMAGIGAAWSVATTPPAAKAVPLRILHREGTNWMAVAADAGNVVTRLYLSSDDGDVWAVAVAHPTATSLFFDAGYNPDTAVIAIVGKTTAGALTVEYSIDLGSTWQVATIETGTAITGVALTSIYYCGGDVWVAVGEYDATLEERALILISNDNAETWAIADSIDLSSFTADLTSIACDGRKLICCGDNGINLHSLSIK